MVVAVCDSRKLIKFHLLFFLCPDSQVQHQEIIVQQPCPPPNGTYVLADNLLLPADHVLDATDNAGATLTALIITSVLCFMRIFTLFVANTRRFFAARRKSNIAIITGYLYM